MVISQHKTFFISDLHLSKNTPHIALLFHYFITNIINPYDTLFILGDFFNYYLGQDLLDPVQEGALQKLKALKEQGAMIYFIPGNRDFLIKEHLLQYYGIKLLCDPSLMKLHGRNVLLSHGDHLCTQDKTYQRYRSFVRCSLVKWFFLCLPKKIRTKIALKIHEQNPHTAFIKDPKYTLADATLSAIEKDLQHHWPDIFIYGHVHKMETFQHASTLRMVLGDWHHTGNYIELSESGIEAKIFSLSTEPS